MAEKNLIQHLFFMLTFGCLTVFSSLAQSNDSLHLNFYMDSYISWFPDQSNAARPAFFVNYTAANKPEINFAACVFHYRSSFFRTTAGWMAGRYTQLNLAAEEPWARYIYEANVGFQLMKNREIWVDAGVLPSHIGFENAAGIKNRTATRSMVAELSPYYETGIRLSYQPNDQWYFAILALNGWQRITAPFSAFGKNWGMQITTKPLNHWILNASSFIGKVKNGNGRDVTRIYSNVYSTLQLNPRMSVLTGWDWGMQENSTRQWHDINLQFRYDFIHKQLASNLRFESFSDPSGIFIQTNDHKKGSLGMSSVNLDYTPFKKSWMLRAELNYLFAAAPVITSANRYIDRQWSFFLLSTIGLDFVP